jgi:RHS repeat-associated protein
VDRTGTKEVKGEHGPWLDAWGNLLSHTGSTEQPYQYVGEYGYYTHYQDANMGGLLGLGVRFLDPSVVRFTQMDDFRQGLCYYAYAKQNPIGNMDPSGRFYIPGVGGCAIAGIVGGVMSAVSGGTLKASLCNAGVGCVVGGLSEIIIEGSGIVATGCIVGVLSGYLGSKGSMMCDKYNPKSFCDPPNTTACAQASSAWGALLGCVGGYFSIKNRDFTEKIEDILKDIVGEIIGQTIESACQNNFPVRWNSLTMAWK